MAKKKKVQKDKQRSTKHTHKSKDQVTRTPLSYFSNIAIQEISYDICACMCVYGGSRTPYLHSKPI
jgi:hypothetical protein